MVSFVEGNYSELLSSFVKYDFRIVRSSSPLEKQLREYFNGSRRKFELNLVLNGTTYQQKVWKELLKVPYGKTISYGELARRVGNPRGARSVGMSVHLNPVGIIVPCHRVIMSNGRIGGYASGVYRKKWLLEHEGSYGSVN